MSGFSIYPSVLVMAFSGRLRSFLVPDISSLGRKVYAGSKSPLDLFNKLSKRLPSNLQCNMFFHQFWLLLRALQSCHWKTSLEEKSRKQKQVKTPGKSDSHTLPPLCLYEYIVSLPIVFVTNLGKHPWCKRYFTNLCIISD